MATATRVVVTGASRGLGLELARRYAGLGCSVVGTYRERTDRIDELDALGCEMYRMRLEEDADRRALCSRLAYKWDTLDLLINNAGTNAKLLQVGAEKAVTAAPESAFLQQFVINSVAPIMLSRLLVPLLRRGKDPAVINLGSRSGLMRWSGGSPDPGYAASKAALHALTSSLGTALAYDGIRVFAVHPGWLRTRIGGESAPETAGVGAQRLIDSVHSARIGDQTSGFIDSSGNVLDWGSTHIID